MGKDAAAKMRRWKRAKAAGVCPRCRNNRPDPGFVECRTCLAAIDKKKRSALARADRDRIRRAVFAHYGDGCACCGETEPLFLEIDHIDGGGGIQRRGGVRGGAYGIYKWLLRHGFPPGYRVLCRNCNYGRFRNGGECPHVAKRVLYA